MEESLTPDADELEARRGADSPGGGSGSGSGSGPGGGRNKGGGARQTTLWLLLLLVVVVAGAGGWKLWEQQLQLVMVQERLERIQGELQASQMQLASVDHERSETGEAVEEQLAFLDSEMRKLWVIAHERNRPAIEALESERDEAGERLSRLESTQEDFSGDLQQTEERLAALSDEVSDYPDVAAMISEEAEAREGLEQALNDRVGRVEQELSDRVDRLERDRRLALEEASARLDALEREVDGMEPGSDADDEIAALSDRVAELEEVVESVDRSRGQLTSRFVELSERVDRLSDRISD